MRWQIYHKCHHFSPQDIVHAILHHRGLTTAEAIQNFLHPPHPSNLPATTAGIDPYQLSHTVDILKSSIHTKQPIIIYGDYDADGVTATAILWETLHHLGAKAYPFIPNREHHGYGLSLTGLTDALKLTNESPIIITVDNGIVAHEAADWLKQQHIPLIITDHHTKGDQLPHAQAIVHSTQISGAGVAWFLAKELSPEYALATLDLVAIGTIADMMPLTGINRSIAVYGLKACCQTKRPGLKALFHQADIDLSQTLNPYHINYIIAPRLNAMGRLEHALDSLRLLCTANVNRAQALATKLGDTNRARQDLTLTLLERAKSQIDSHQLDPILIVDDDKFHEGIIGLIAGKLVETYYRPSIVISKKDGISKASARSIKGVNITELIRSQSHLLLGVGGHPMAAGFSLAPSNITEFKHSLIQLAKASLHSELFDPILEIDCEVFQNDLTLELYQELQQLQPFGLGNQEPLFALKGVEVVSLQTIGKNNNHLKLRVKQGSNLPFDALWFNPPSSTPISPRSHLDLAGYLSINTWRNKTTLQFIVKDCHLPNT